MAPQSLTPKVRVGGSALPEAWLGALLEVRVEQELQVPARTTLRFADPGYTLVEAGKATLGAELEVTDPHDHVLMVGDITSVGVDQRAGEQPELVVVALDRSWRLARSTEILVFQNMTYSDMITKVARDTDSGLSVSEVEPTGVVEEYLMQADSGLGLISELARRTGYDWWVRGTDLHFAPPSDDPVVSLTLGEGLRSFSARVSGATPARVEVYGWDREQQQVVSGAASPADAVPAVTSALGEQALSPDRKAASATVIAAELGARSPGEADVLAKSIAARARQAAVLAKGLADGDGRIAPATGVVIKDAGPLSGRYPVTKVEHVYRPSLGFVTRFHSGERRPASLVDTLGAPGQAAAAFSGPAHLRYGVTVGLVTSNNDPQRMGRVRVRYPGLRAGEESAWARLVSVGGGRERGSVWIPEANDEVLVAFEGGDPRQPVVVGGLFGSKSVMPSTQIDSGAVQSRAMTSRLGHVVSLLDGEAPAAQAIELVLAGKEHTLHLGKDNVTVQVPQGTPVKVAAGSTSIEFSDSGDITVSGVNVTVKADAALKLQGTTVEVAAQATLNLQAQGESALKGAIVEVQAEGPAKLAGTPVMIN